LRIASEETDYLLIGFANGKILQLCIDLKVIAARQASQTSTQGGMHDYIRKAILDKDHSSAEKVHGSIHTGPIWGAQVSFIGTVHTKMQRVQTLNGPAIIACSNKPVVFYIN
jgi:hypothetical protein